MDNLVSVIQTSFLRYGQVIQITQRWAANKPQSIGFGIVLILFGLTPIPRLLIFGVAGVLITSGVYASWKYLKE